MGKVVCRFLSFSSEAETIDRSNSALLKSNSDFFKLKLLLKNTLEKKKFTLVVAFFPPFFSFEKLCPKIEKNCVDFQQVIVELRFNYVNY